jgi:hypothetical protein
MMFPGIAPQWRVESPRRAAGGPHTMTVAEPLTMMYVFGPQHAACVPLSPRRAWGGPQVMTVGAPLTIGPTQG